MHKRLISLILLTLLAQPAVGETSMAGVDPAAPKPVMDLLSRLVPDARPNDVEASPVDGLYQVAYGAQVIYVSADGRYLFKGDLVDVVARRNLTEEKRGGARLAALDTLGESSMVVFAPEKTKHTVTVFTDIDCPYCVRFHQQVPELNENGVKVRYLAFPRSGVDSAAYRKAVSVWCAEDRSRAMTDAKAGRNVPEKSCDNPVGEHFETGRALGITGTPTLVLDNGKVVPGYVPTNQLIAALNGARPR